MSDISSRIFESPALGIIGLPGVIVMGDVVSEEQKRPCHFKDNEKFMLIKYNCENCTGHDKTCDMYG